MKKIPKGTGRGRKKRRAKMPETFVQEAFETTKKESIGKNSEKLIRKTH